MVRARVAAIAPLALLSLLVALAVGGYLPSTTNDDDECVVGARGALSKEEPRVVFSVTTTPRRIDKLKPVIDAIVEGQTRPPDAVFLSVKLATTKLPEWLHGYNGTSRRPGVLQVLHMPVDYGPASKLLAALAEGGERGKDTLVIYGDDDVIYGNSIVEQHIEAQLRSTVPTAFGTRKIGIGKGSKHESLLEGVGSISVRASLVPESVFDVQGMPPACRLSDDYWISHHLAEAGVALDLLPRCVYDFSTEAWPRSCGTPFHDVRQIRHIGALSETVISHDGSVVTRSGGDWRSQLGRYEVCQDLLRKAKG
eukprot:TRINITY_DN35661_c0_g1_i1.p1 TRINITY_DN35661_c0_g1~~TRINITY_DN35661_c0_g1_i1.p1  ORF type:complete len:364 (+),score=71.06 TRINITY_DN35661_c0_g1_i1:165-1094(+)